MPTPNQQLEPSKLHHSLKPLYWIIPLVILAALTAGYFAYQNYLLQKTASGIFPKAPAANQITKEQAIDLTEIQEGIFKLDPIPTEEIYIPNLPQKIYEIAWQNDGNKVLLLSAKPKEGDFLSELHPVAIGMVDISQKTYTEVYALPEEDSENQDTIRNFSVNNDFTIVVFDKTIRTDNVYEYVIELISLQNGEVTTIKTLKDTPYSQISPDGKYVLYSQKGNPAIIDIQGNNIADLGDLKIYSLLDLYWKPDSTGLIYQGIPDYNDNEYKELAVPIYTKDISTGDEKIFFEILAKNVTHPLKAIDPHLGNMLYLSDNKRDAVSGYHLYLYNLGSIF